MFEEGHIDSLTLPGPFKMGCDGVYALDKAPNGQQGGTVDGRDPGAGGGHRDEPAIRRGS